MKDNGPLPGRFWKGKSKRLMRGSDRRFVKHPLIDDEEGQAGHVLHFFNNKAISTSRLESSKVLSGFENHNSDKTKSEGE